MNVGTIGTPNLNRTCLSYVVGAVMAEAGFFAAIEPAVRHPIYPEFAPGEILTHIAYHRNAAAMRTVYSRG